jgi:hypothetical protein
MRVGKKTAHIPDSAAGNLALQVYNPLEVFEWANPFQSSWEENPHF